MATSDKRNIIGLGSVPRHAAQDLVDFGQPDSTLVLLGIGQSNMSGSLGGPVMTALETGAGEPEALVDGIFMQTSEGNVVPARVPTSESSQGLVVDPLFHVARQLKKHLGRNQKLLLVNAAVGSTGLVAGDWQPGGTEYDAALSRVNDVLGSEPNATLLGIFWHQGENDAASETTAYQHFGLLKTLITNLRTNIVDDYLGTQENVPFVLGTVGESDDTFSDHLVEINANNMTIPHQVPYTACADLRDLDFLADGVHFTVASKREIGRRYAHAFYEALANSNATGASVLVPTPSWVIRATAATFTLGDLAVTSPKDTAPTLSAAGGTPVVGALNTETVRNFGYGALSGAIDINEPVKTRGYTIAGWARVVPLPGAADAPMLGAQTGTPIAPGHQISLRYESNDADGAPRFRIGAIANNLSGTSGANECISQTLISVDRWFHFAVVSLYGAATDADKHTYVLYVNGRYEDQRNQELVTATTMRISYSGTPTGTPFPGIFDELTYWPAPLTHKQIMEHMRVTTVSGDVELR